MRRGRRDPNADQRVITPTPKVLAEQERLQAEANQIEALSKTQARIAGFTVTLDPFSGALTCSGPACPTECRHVVTVREHAVKRVQR